MWVTIPNSSASSVPPLQLGFQYSSAGSSQLPKGLLSPTQDFLLAHCSLCKTRSSLKSWLVYRWWNSSKMNNGKLNKRKSLIFKTTPNIVPSAFLAPFTLSFLWVYTVFLPKHAHNTPAFHLFRCHFLKEMDYSVQVKNSAKIHCLFSTLPV